MMQNFWSFSDYTRSVRSTIIPLLVQNVSAGQPSLVTTHSTAQRIGLVKPKTRRWVVLIATRYPDRPLDKEHTECGAIFTELPYAGGLPFGGEKRCLSGTRKDFLDYIFKWVEDAEFDRTLVILGQAGTGKSSIAHEVARQFENKHLGSYFAFRRKEGSKDEAHQLFTTLARDLSNRYPLFKLALRKVLKDDSSLYSTRHYGTLFKRILLEPVKVLQLDEPILIVIDALDESSDANGQKGLYEFLAQHLSELPSNFRILITSRLEKGIGCAFSNARSVRTLYMDDHKLAAKTEQDIGLYLQNKLPWNLFERHGVQLAKAAEGLFQWAAVASGLINNPPASFGFSRKQVIRCLLGHSRDRDGQDPLDQLYREVLEGYFKTLAAQTLFRSVMGQLFAAMVPLSIRSLTILWRHAPKDDPEDPDPEDSDCVVEMLRHLDSLLSNVTSSDDTLPILSHTSFRDFLANEKSGVFHIDLGRAHRRLAHSCFGLMLNDLKFNICELESSYLANRDVPDLDSRIAKHIPPALSYACVFWVNHLEHLAFEDRLTKLESLFETKFLFWLEVLSLTSNVGLAFRALSSLLEWLQREVGTAHDSI
jgi:NACHT domain